MPVVICRDLGPDVRGIWLPDEDAIVIGENVPIPEATQVLATLMADSDSAEGSVDSVDD